MGPSPYINSFKGSDAQMAFPRIKLLLNLSWEQNMIRIVFMDLKYREGGVQPPVSPGVTRKQHNKAQRLVKFLHDLSK